jgi:hypothetical protein
MHVIVSYFALAGTLTAAMKTGRGLLRSVGRLAAGDPRGALVEATAAAAAPVAAAYQELRQLGDEIGAAVGDLVGQVEGEGAAAPASLAKPSKRARQAAATPAADGLAV